MFVISLKSRLFKRVALCCVVLFSVAVLVVLFRCGSGESSASTRQVNSSIDDSDAVLSFVTSLGWEVVETPDEIREVIIPPEFDEVYTNYNKIQLEQNYDLSKYAGERVKKWTYTIKNYPAFEGEEFIKINVLVFDGKVIGGDVCSVKIDGFMHGFTYENS